MKKTVMLLIGYTFVSSISILIASVHSYSFVIGVICSCISLTCFSLGAIELSKLLKYLKK